MWSIQVSNWEGESSSTRITARECVGWCKRKHKGIRFRPQCTASTSWGMSIKLLLSETRHSTLSLSLSLSICVVWLNLLPCAASEWWIAAHNMWEPKLHCPWGNFYHFLPFLLSSYSWWSLAWRVLVAMPSDPLEPRLRRCEVRYLVLWCHSLCHPHRLSSFRRQKPRCSISEGMHSAQGWSGDPYRLCWAGSDLFLLLGLDRQGRHQDPQVALPGRSEHPEEDSWSKSCNSDECGWDQSRRLVQAGLRPGVPERWWRRRRRQLWWLPSC